MTRDGERLAAAEARIEEMRREIAAMDERGFSDNVTSLRSRITVIERDSAVSRGKLALIVAIITALVTFLATNWQSVLKWLPKLNSGGMERMYYLYTRANQIIRSILAHFWLIWIVVWLRLVRVF